MKYKLLGKSGLRVAELCLGTVTFGEEWKWGANKDESRKIFDLYQEAGGNFLDTANLYTNGTSEKYVGEFVGYDRDRFVIATKYSYHHNSKDVNLSGNHRKNLVQSVEKSLQRLQMDFVDILWLHGWDFTTPIEEVMRSLDDLVRAGKVLYIGASNTPAWVVSAANTLAREKGWTPFIALQIEYSLKERTPERDLLPMARAFGLTITPWAPLAGGLLTGKYLQNGKGRGRLDIEQYENLTEAENERQEKIAACVVFVAKECQRSPAQVALSWLLQQGKDIIPILGARTAEQLQDNLGCLTLTLSKEQMEKLNQVSQISMGSINEIYEISIDLCFNGSLRNIDQS